VHKRKNNTQNDKKTGRIHKIQNKHTKQDHNHKKYLETSVKELENIKVNQIIMR
jgi:hypothetical protein